MKCDLCEVLNPAVEVLDEREKHLIAQESKELSSSSARASAFVQKRKKKEKKKGLNSGWAPVSRDTMFSRLRGPDFTLNFVPWGRLC
jgi:hypothetical protein